MPTSYTDFLGLALPVQGELTGSWGNEVNNFITSYVDAAVAGTQTISGSQTAVTLSKTTNASLSQAGSGATGSAQYPVINCTGNPAGTLTITISYASLTNATFSKTFIVINATSTSQSVIVKATTGTGTSTGITLIAGEKALIAWNGSDFTKVVTTAAAAGSNTQIQYNSSGNFAGSANLTFDGTNVQIGSQGDLRLGDSDNSNYVALQAPATVASNVTFTLPSADGTSGQTVTTNGSGALSFGTLGVAGGGTGLNTTTAYGLIAAGTTATGAFQQVSGTGTSGQLLTSNGAGALPTWQTTTGITTGKSIAMSLIFGF